MQGNIRHPNIPTNEIKKLGPLVIDGLEFQVEIRTSAQCQNNHSIVLKGPLDIKKPNNEPIYVFDEVFFSWKKYPEYFYQTSFPSFLLCFRKDGFLTSYRKKSFIIEEQMHHTVFVEVVGYGMCMAQIKYSSIGDFLKSHNY